MSLTLITALTSLRVLVGVAGAGYSIYTNKIQDNAVNAKDVGNFNFGEIPKAIFGQVVGGIFYDFIKGGTSAGYEQFLQRISASSVETLNHDLQRAARKATLLATYFACQGCLADIKLKRHSIWKQFKDIAWKGEDINWLVAVSKSLKDEIKNIDSITFDENINYKELFSIFDKDNLANPEEKQEELSKKLKEETLNDIKNSYYAKFGGQITIPFSQNAFDLLSEAINDGWEQFAEDESFIIQLKLTAHGSRVKKYDWFQLLCVIFNEEYKVNEKVEAAIQKQTALEQTALLKQISANLQSFGQIEDFENLTQEVLSFKEEIFEILDRIDEGIGELKEGQGEIKNLIRQISPEKQNEPQTFVSLPNLVDKIYGRNDEIANILVFLKTEKNNGVIVAPTCFGKTFLIKKFLYKTIDDRQVKADYQMLFAKVIYLDCRINLTFDNIVKFFATLRGETLEYRTGNEANFLRQDVFGKLQTEKILLIFDNFESWITKTGKYVNEDVEIFLKTFFYSNHRMRGFFVSQKLPNAETTFFEVKKLETISDKLLNGLDEKSALEFTKKEGADVGLDEISDADLKMFFERVYYIPQAIQSMIGYLASVGVSFYRFEKDFFEDFDAEERREKDIGKRLDEKLRPTKALIKRQISAQDDKTKELLSLLAFFDNPVPKEVLLLDFKNAAAHQTASPEIYKAVKNLTDNRLAQTETDLVKDIDYKTNRAEDIIYHRLHPLFREIVRELFKFEDENSIYLTNYTYELMTKGNQAYFHNHFRKAIAFYKCAESIEKHLVYEKGNEYRRNVLADTYIGVGLALWSQGRLAEAIIEYDKSIEIYERLVNKENRGELANELAKTYMNKGITLDIQGKPAKAIIEYDKAIEIYERLVNQENRGELADELAKTYMNKGIALWTQGKPAEAIIEHDRAISIYERLVNQENRGELANSLAMTCMNKGIALWSQDKSAEAIIEYDKAIAIYERLVNQENRGELADDLATVYMNKGVTLDNQGNLPEAVVSFDKAVEVRNLCLARNEFHVLPDYIMTFRNRIKVHIKLENWQRTGSDVVKAFDFENRWQSVEFPEHFERLIKIERNEIIRLLREVPAENREKIYTHAGENGDEIRRLVDDFEENAKGS